MSTGGKKKFVMKHVYTDVNNLKTAELHQKKEAHLGLNWAVFFMRDRSNFWLGLWGEPDDSDRERTMDATISAKLKVITGEEVIVRKFKFSNESRFCYFKDKVPLNNYIVNGNVSVELHVTTDKYTGIEDIPEKKILRSFDESNKEFSDVVLVVKDQKFYVCKMYLASHSSYFKAQEAAAKYKMEKLLGKCISEIKSIADIEQVMPEDFTGFDPNIPGKLLKLSIDLYKKK